MLPGKNLSADPHPTSIISVWFNHLAQGLTPSQMSGPPVKLSGNARENRIVIRCSGGAQPSGWRPRPVVSRVSRTPPMNEVTRILWAIENGDPQAADQLLPLVYDQLRRSPPGSSLTRNRTRRSRRRRWCTKRISAWLVPMSPGDGTVAGPPGHGAWEPLETNNRHDQDG